MHEQLAECVEEVQVARLASCSCPFLCLEQYVQLVSARRIGQSGHALHAWFHDISADVAAAGSQAATAIMVMMATRFPLRVMGRTTGLSGGLGTLWVPGCTSADRRSFSRE